MKPLNDELKDLLAKPDADMDDVRWAVECAASNRRPVTTEEQEEAMRNLGLSGDRPRCSPAHAAEDLETMLRRVIREEMQLNTGYLDAAASARYLGCSRRALGDWTAKGWVTCHKRGKRHLRYRRSDLDDFMARHRLAPTHHVARIRRRALRRGESGSQN